MRRKIASVIFILLISMVFCQVHAANQIEVTFDGAQIKNLQPKIIDNCIKVSLRTIFESLGAKVQWDNKSKGATITKENTKAILTLNSDIAEVNGRQVKLDSPVTSIQARNMVPVTAVEQCLGMRVYVDNANSKVTILSTDRQCYLNYSGDKMLNYDYMVNMQDSDNDGLSDYEEINKYLSDPNNADSDNDGINDGDWEERREYAYSIYARRELNAPFNSASLKDSFEDIRIISEDRKKLVYDVVLYPYAKDVVTGNMNWTEYRTDPRFAELLKPRKTTNWDADMQKRIVSSIPDSCKTDLEVVNFLIPYYLSYKRANPQPMQGDPTDLFVDLRGVSPTIYNRDIWNKDKRDKNVPDSDLIDQILFARRMFNNRIDGACTASATYMTAVLRSAGIPARIIETNSLLHHGDNKQVKLVYGLKNKEIRDELLKQGDSYYGHYYIEAYVGGRWIKINNNGKICESNYIPGFPGAFLIKADTFFDYADTAMVDIFKNYFPERPYKLVSLKDQYGKYYRGNVTAEQPKETSPSNMAIYKLGDKGFDNIENYRDVKGYYIYSSNENFWRSVSGAVNGKKILQKASIEFFKSEILNDSNAIVISTDTPYKDLPQEIKSRVSESDYFGLETDEYYLFTVSKAQVIILCKQNEEKLN